MSRKNTEINILRKSFLLLSILLLISTMFITLFSMNFFPNFDQGYDSNEIFVDDDLLSSKSATEFIEITETAGLDRVNEPVTISLPRTSVNVSWDDFTDYSSSVNITNNQTHTQIEELYEYNYTKFGWNEPTAPGQKMMWETYYSALDTDAISITSYEGHYNVWNWTNATNFVHESQNDLPVFTEFDDEYWLYLKDSDGVDDTNYAAFNTHYGVHDGIYNLWKVTFFTETRGISDTKGALYVIRRGDGDRWVDNVVPLNEWFHVRVHGNKSNIKVWINSQIVDDYDQTMQSGDWDSFEKWSPNNVSFSTGVECYLDGISTDINLNGSNKATFNSLVFRYDHTGYINSSTIELNNKTIQNTLIEYNIPETESSHVNAYFRINDTNTWLDKTETIGLTLNTTQISLQFTQKDDSEPCNVKSVIIQVIDEDQFESGEVCFDSVRVYDGLTEIPSQVSDAEYDTFDADHNFKSSNNWGDPIGWILDEPSSTNLRILPNYYGHSKVCEFYDDSTIDGGKILEDYIGQSNGAIEFWFMCSDVTLTFNAGFQNNGGTLNEFWIKTQDDQLYYYEGSWYDSGYSLSDNTWYHVRITFESTTGGYDGLAEDYWRVYITPLYGSTTQLGDYTMVTGGTVGRTIFGTEHSHAGYSAFLDAVDYSWEPSYFQGRNKYLQSFKISFLANVSAHATKTYSINYGSSSLGNPGYLDMITGSDYIEDGLGGQWYLETLATQEVMRGTRDPNGNFVSGDGTNQGILQLVGDDPTATRFMDVGPIFCQVGRIQTGGYAIVDVYTSGIARARVLDDANYHAIVWGLRHGVGTDEHHYKIDGSWNVRDPINLDAGSSWTYGIVTSTNYDGQSLFNNDGENWILATLVNTDQLGVNDFSIAAYTEYSGGHLFSIGDTMAGSSIPANTETEIFWALLNSTADDDVQQRIDVEDLYTKLIMHPLISSPSGVDTNVEAPIGLTAQPSRRTNINSFNVTWTNPNDPSGIVGAYYKQYSPPTSDTDGTYVAGANLQVITGLFVPGNGSYPIYVWLKDSEGNIHYSNFSMTYLHYDYIPPDPPSVSYAQAGGSSATLYWSLILDGNVDHYNIYRSSNPIGSVTGMTPIASVGNMTGSYTDTGLSDGTYYYVVTAVDDLGQESLVSNNVMVDITFTRWIIIIIIVIFGIIGGGGATVGVVAFRRRRTDYDGYKPKEYKTKGPVVQDFSKPKKKGTKQLDPDLIKRVKESEYDKVLTLPRLMQDNIISHKLLEQKDFADPEEKISLISDILSLPEAERIAILKNLEINEERLLLKLKASLENVEIFKSKNKIEYLRNEYIKILTMAEKLGNNKLFERYKAKLEELEIEMEYDEN